jgi:hypothetical protein
MANFNTDGYPHYTATREALLIAGLSQHIPHRGQTELTRFRWTV